MQIKLSSIMVDDQDKALRFYTAVVGFVKKTDLPMGPFRWLTVTSPEGAVKVAHNCPSGANTYERTDGGPQESAPPVNTAHVRENGPLAFRAELVVGGKPAGFRATLCRCGTSKNKPWCDTSHVAAGFKASGEPATQNSEPLARRNGPLAITPTKNGPLEVTGGLEICTGTGRTVLRTQQTWLCRCGGSSNKPFCDGTHAKIGFIG